jgi:hypothetical protein
VELPESVRPLFAAAGWHFDRRIAVQFDRVQDLLSYPLAAPLLQTFGGLQVGECGGGRDWAASDVQFTNRPSVDDRYAVADLEQPGDDLFPLGMAHRQHLELFLDACGRLVVYDVPGGTLSVAGRSFQAGIERILLGHRWPA